MSMAKRAPSITPEERARNQREADERQRARCVEAARAMTGTAVVWLVEHGAMVPGEGVRERLRRLDGYRRALVQASAPSYRPTARQQMARDDVEFDL